MAQTATDCPDGATCHHRCLSGCWRVAHNEAPINRAGDTWKPYERHNYGTVVQEGTPRPPTTPSPKPTPGHRASPVHWGSQQGRILAFLHTYLAEHGYPPTIREIGAAVGLSSSSSVAHQLGVLEARGHIRRAPGQSRAITLLTPPPQP